MRRVFSRQRLNSDEIFDVVTSDRSLSDEEFITCCDDDALSHTTAESSDGLPGSPPSATRPPVLIFTLPGRKRLRSPKKRQQQQPVAAAAAFGCFDKLVDDMKLQVCAYLNVQEAFAFMTTSKAHLKLLDHADCLWRGWCYRMWPDLPTGADIVDKSSKRTDFKFLLSLSSRSRPRVLTSSFMRARRGVDGESTSLDDQSIFRLVPYEGRPVVQFTGVVGTGDRCIRADKPFPRSSRPSKSANRLLRFLRRGNPEPRPFVVPFVCDNQIHLTPRSVCYFEITILPQVPPLPNEEHMAAALISDCVAVGVSIKEFCCNSRMPGWDSCSFGYHGDDGGIFHASGEMQQRFGPPFGKGDTVGCGVDHRNGGIFFVLNGKFLGYAWEDLSVAVRADLFPTVGVDTNHPIDANFGSRAFCFDLAGFIQRPVEKTQPAAYFNM